MKLGLNYLPPPFQPGLMTSDIVLGRRKSPLPAGLNSLLLFNSWTGRWALHSLIHCGKPEKSQTKPTAFCSRVPISFKNDIPRIFSLWSLTVWLDCFRDKFLLLFTLLHPEAAGVVWQGGCSVQKVPDPVKAQPLYSLENMACILSVWFWIF